ncbi:MULTISPECIES: hypothetical protein [Ensifer]|uniref:Uncharacterized protein n=1 Tax=Ensifer canadensis TaxID=555315 RepID=A0AAW4FL39_9HYPH|nr:MULTISPECIES: hypothetical protein [Ensifer]KQU91994.1 hypothetical protein ASD00_25015 [Ensifer sp. Root31]KQW60279.1 hypothetical protein ASD02_26875 [Ensifer sp. Root1252]KQW70291.1 hypothetical protein ASD03_33155 [Ensifer sp. Root127]KQY73532.1 hypothetical protein ASD52_26525 [Ensifer sp. Root142]KRC76050.1 hypothetical protein ASE32_30550 [Ensifer sp. Root231]
MNENRPDKCMMIGLHKLAAQNGDGLVPELYELLTRRSRMIEENPNVTEFPSWETRRPGRDPFGLAEPQEGTILAFPRAANDAARKKDSA